MSGSIDIARATSANDEVRALVEELEGELAAHYPAEQRHGLELSALFQPHIRFFIARIDGSPAGCRGVTLFGDFAELKRMYVRPPWRGGGVADAVLARLEAESLETGLAHVKLETGTQQTAALRFYERNGFTICPPFEPYASMPPQAIATSVFMEKRLPISL